MLSRVLSLRHTVRNVTIQFAAILLLCATFFITATPTFAANGFTVRDRLQNIGEAAGLPVSSGQAVTIPVLAGSIVRAALTLIGLIFLILTVYGGSLYLTAGGNEETVKKAKNIIVRAMIGILIVVFAGAITQFIVSQIQSPGGTDACTPGDSYPTTLLGGCDRPGYTQTGLTCECH